MTRRIEIPQTGLARPRTITVRTSVSGSYQRKKGSRGLYEYAGSYGVNSEGTWWLVTVRSEGRLKGTPIGTLVTEISPDETQIYALIERQIEDLDQVRE